MVFATPDGVKIRVKVGGREKEKRRKGLKVQTSFCFVPWPIKILGGGGGKKGEGEKRETKKKKEKEIIDKKGKKKKKKEGGKKKERDIYPCLHVSR